jgi:hypothetical protein
MSGFTYLPEAFTTEDIRVRQSGWKDMNVPDSIDFMVEIVKDMYYTIVEEKRKVLVHCHAGYGRTGIVLACYMLYTSTKSAEEVVQELRAKRSGCVQKKSQMDYIKKFQVYLIRARETFTGQKRELDFYIKHQLDLIPQLDSHKYLHIPRILIDIIERLTSLITEKDHEHITIYQCFNGNHEWKDEYEQILTHLKNSINKGVWDCLGEMDDILILIELLYDWLDDNVTFIIHTNNLDSIFKNSFERELRSQIDKHKEFTVDTRKLIIDKLKTELKMPEFECLSCISYFISFILPSDNLEHTHELNLMFDKIAIYLLGYNIDLVYEGNSDDADAQKCKKYVNQVKDLLHFFALVCKFDWADTKGRKGCGEIMSNYLKRIYAFNDEYEVISIHRSNANLLQRLKTYRGIEDIIQNNTSKEDFMRNMYKSLKDHFENPNKRPTLANGDKKSSEDLDNFNDFFLSFLDFVNSVKKGEQVSPNSSLKGSPKSILKQTFKDSSFKSSTHRKESSSFALVLKNTPSYDVEDDEEPKFVRSKNPENKYKTQIVKKLEFDSKIENDKKSERDQNILNFINNNVTFKSKKESPHRQDRPKARKTVKLAQTAMPNLYHINNSRHLLLNEIEKVKESNSESFSVESELSKNIK